MSRNWPTPVTNRCHTAGSASAPGLTIAAPDGAREFRVLHFDRVALGVERLCHALALEPERNGHQRWLSTLAELLERLPRLMRPRAVYRIDDVRQLENRRLELASNAVFEGAIGQFLAESTLVATFIVTIGSAVERLSRGWLRRGQVMRGVVADAIASEAAEAVADLCQQEVRRWAQPRGLDLTPRYSPGYCGMDVRRQIPLFASLPASRINVHLTPSCLMVPVKSVSGLIGIGPAERVGPLGYPCQFCDHPNCMQRRAPHEVNCATRFDWTSAAGRE